MSDTMMLRIGIVIAGVLLMAAIYIFGRPGKPQQGRKRSGESARPAGQRGDPGLAQAIEDARARPHARNGHDGAHGGGMHHDGMHHDADADPPDPVAEPLVPGGVAQEVGRREREEFDKIVTLYVAARAGRSLHGPDIVVAAEKAGLSYGYMQIFHRLVEGRPLDGPIFSVANIKKPGSFDMADIHHVETPAIAFFLTLPAPIAALDAWEKMLPTAQRMAELLDGLVLDESRNELSRQRIAHIRDDLRAYDRMHEAQPIGKNTKW